MNSVFCGIKPGSSSPEYWTRGCCSSLRTTPPSSYTSLTYILPADSLYHGCKRFEIWIKHLEKMGFPMKITDFRNPLKNEITNLPPGTSKVYVISYDISKLKTPYHMYLTHILARYPVKNEGLANIHRDFVDGKRHKWKDLINCHYKYERTDGYYGILYTENMCRYLTSKPLSELIKRSEIFNGMDNIINSMIRDRFNEGKLVTLNTSRGKLHFSKGTIIKTKLQNDSLPAGSTVEVCGFDSNLQCRVITPENFRGHDCGKKFPGSRSHYTIYIKCI